MQKCVQEQTIGEAVRLLQNKAAEYGVLGNCPELAIPWDKDLVWDQLDTQTRTRDATLQGLQQCFLQGLTAVGEAVDTTRTRDDERHFKPEVRMLLNATQLIGGATVDFGIKHRELIKPALNS